RPGAVAEIWAFGLRNPWRFSFDSRSGALFLGNVGQNDIEEVELVVRGRNYGWNFKEGTLFFHINGNEVGFASEDPDPSRGPIPPGLIDPIAQYDTHHEGHSVIGGYVYHGGAIPQLHQKYVFGEFALVFRFPLGPHDSGRLFSIKPGGQHGPREISQLIVVPGGALHLAVLGIGQDAHGELYVLGNISGVPFGTGGRVLKLVPAPEADD
ncbi:MAG: PQQ-dependent sugar dehydrogenase, partial [candidate division NC10 bacterium]|nr:PQQ-dependent sugar dehydrogenase [candidate division NC10 bacterium]